MADLKVPNLNKVFLSGRLTRDPELKYTPSGTAVVSIPLAVNRRYRDQSGEWKEDTLFITVVAWQALAERCGKSLHKGSPVLVEGVLQSRSWETSDGQKRSVIEVRADRVQFLEWSDITQEDDGGSAKPDSGEPPAETDDDLPF
jgi:single-strand DNA-binding protein